MSVLDNFDSWKGFLANKLDHAESKGMGENTITNIAHTVGDFLSEHVEAENKEQAILRELWNAASEEEQQAIASSMVKLVQNEGK